MRGWRASGAAGPDRGRPATPAATGRYACIHGHFYQPPRENPWLGVVEAEDSAAPHHDWNERIDAECYAANASARVLDGRGRITAIVSNYERISFNVGPTLLSWMERADRATYEAILEADRASAIRLGGHGNAIAQAYGHAILPLADPRDRATQVRWGIADFRRRFGRAPEGMWLPETAVDTPTLEELARCGIGFTILAPHQAAAVAPIDADEWTATPPGSIDTTIPYRCDLPSGRSIALFFYDGPLAQAVAFGGLLADGREYARRLAALVPSAAAAGPRLAHVATDGETYGHHHRFGDMALAAALRAVEQDHGLRVVNYGWFLARNPPRMRARIREGTSWSCAHGVQRWRADCGCAAGRGQGWNQAWRAPLRSALESLKAGLDAVFEREGGWAPADPWRARDEYVEVVLDRSQSAVDRFLDRHRAGPLDPAGVVRALRALEMQRAGLLMFTSCGWFFDDVGGIETVQVLKYACRAAHLAKTLSGEDLETPLLAALERARSNVPAIGDAAAVYRRQVLPLAVDLRRVAAHHAIAGVLDPAEAEPKPAYSYEVQRLDWAEEEWSDSRLAVGRVMVTSVDTRESAESGVALLYFGGHDFRCDVFEPGEPEAFAQVRDELLDKYTRHSLSDVVTAMNRRFGEAGSFTLRDAFLEERRRILAGVVARTLADLEAQYVAFHREHGRLLAYLAGSGAPLPEAFRIAAEFALSREAEPIVRALAERAADPVTCLLDDSIDDLRRVAAQASELGVRLRSERLRAALAEALPRLVDSLGSRIDAARVEAIGALLDLAVQSALPLDLWRVQNAAFRMLSEPGWSGRIEAATPARRVDVERRVLALADRLNLAPERVSRV